MKPNELVQRLTEGEALVLDTQRDRFELHAAEFFGRTLQVIQASRMSNGSYNEPKLAQAWYFYSVATV